MHLSESGIVHKQVTSTRVAYIRFNLKDRAEIRQTMQEIADNLPNESICGDPYCQIQFFSSYTEGYEAEVGFPVKDEIGVGRIKTKTCLALEVLALMHSGAPEKVPETRARLAEFSRHNGLISDEFTREVHLDWQNPQGAIEVQFVLHQWNALLACHLERVLGRQKRDVVLEGMDAIGVETDLMQRFTWTKGAIERLNGLADEAQKYDIVSSCAHIFPPGMLESLKRVYIDARLKHPDALQAVDEVLAFMEKDPGWGPTDQRREGRLIIHTKNPADPQAHQAAASAEEKRAAYCFCPVIRKNLQNGMPPAYCYCGAGWFRQQWEYATGKPVRVEVLQSVAQGDDVCQFAVHLADEL